MASPKPMKRSELKRGTSTMKTTKPLARKSPMLRGDSQIARQAKPKPKKSRGPGLKGRTPTAAERAFMDLAGKVPCMACLKDGRRNTHISLHHIDGRTKPGAHFLVLPLCGPHHQQDDTDPLERISLHGNKRLFGQLYGTERELLAELYALLDFSPPPS